MKVIAQAKLILQNRQMSLTLCKNVIDLALKLTKWQTSKTVIFFLVCPVVFGTCYNEEISNNTNTQHLQQLFAHTYLDNTCQQHW